MPMRMPKFRFTRRVGKILLSIVAVALLLCGVAAWQVPKVLRSVLTEDVSKMLGRDVSVGKISFNPFTLTVRARDLAIAQPGSETPLLTLAELDASAAWSSLFWFAPVVDRLTLREPKIAIVREDVTRFNFSDVQQRVAEMSAAKPEEPPKPDEGPPRFSLNNMRIEGGSVTLDDKVTGRKQVVDEFTLGVPFISTFGYATDIDVQPRLHLRINGSPFDLTGVARPFEKVPSSTLNVTFSGLQLEKWADVWPMPLPFSWSARCSIRTCAWCSSSRRCAAQDPGGGRPGPAPVRPARQVGRRAGVLERADGIAAGTRTDCAAGLYRRCRPVGAAGACAPLREPEAELAGRGRAAAAAGRKPGAAKPAGGKPVAGKPADAKTQDAKAAPNAGKAAAQPADPQASAKVSAAQAGAPEAGKAASAAAAAKPAGVKPADAKAGDAKAADAKSADAKAAEAKAAEPKSAIPAAGGAAAGAATPSASAAAGAAPPAGPAGTAPAPQPAEPAEWKITLDAFNIHEGELHLTDAVSKLDYSMTGIAATVEGVEIPQQKDRPINLWLTVDNSTDGGWIRAKGPLVLQPLALEMSFRMGNVALAPLAPAVRSAAPITLQDGRVALSAQVHVLDKGGAVDVSATGAQAELTQFKARDESLKPALDVALQRLHLTADRLAMGPGQSNFTLDADGVQGNGKLA